jgi:hypothetical protein
MAGGMVMQGRETGEREIDPVQCADRDAFPGRVQVPHPAGQVPGLIARRIRAAARDVCLHSLVAGFRRALCAPACARTEGGRGQVMTRRQAEAIHDAGTETVVRVLPDWTAKADRLTDDFAVEDFRRLPRLPGSRELLPHPRPRLHRAQERP